MFLSLRSLFYPASGSLPSLGTSTNPIPSSLFTYCPSINSWIPIQTPHPHAIALPDGLHIITWNVDFGEPYPERRIKGALDHLHSLLYSRSSWTNQAKPGYQSELPPAVLLFQEVHSQALEAILADFWVREEFIITNTTLMSYAEKYGTVTLISRCLAPAMGSAFRIPFQNSVMGRDALFVDLNVKRLPSPVTLGAVGGGEGDGCVGVLRIANTHLESLLGHGAEVRPAQLKEVHRILFTQGVYVGVVGGDMGAIGPGDEGLAEKVGFTDLWAATGDGGAGGEKCGGQTWGYQPQCAFKPGRLDKILACGNLGMVNGTVVETVGEGCSVGLDGESIWVSDHYGLMWVVKLNPA